MPGFTDEEWEKAAGEPCPFCLQNSLRLIDGRCSQCYGLQQGIEDRKMERKSRERELRSIFRHRRAAVGR